MTIRLTALNPSDPGHPIGSLNRPSDSSRQRPNIFSRGYSAGTEIAGTVTKVGYGLAQIVIGVITAIGSFISASLWKDHTLADWGSKVLAAIALFFVGKGSWDIWKVGKSEGKEKACESTHLKIANYEDIKTAEAEISKHDKQFLAKYDPTKVQIIRENKKDGPDLTTQASVYLDKIAGDDARKKLETISGGAPPKIEGVSEGPKDYDDYKDTVAWLSGYVVKDFGDEVAGNYVNALPEDFVRLYKIARWYNNEQKGKDNSVTEIINYNGGINCLSTYLSSPEPRGNNYLRAREYLLENQNTQNFLKTVAKVVEYVRANFNSTDPKVARDVGILKQSLVCAFKLDGKNKSEIDRQLQIILDGDETSKSLKEKVRQIDEHFVQIDQLLQSKPECVFVRGQYSAGEGAILGGLMLGEITEKA